MVFSPKFDQLIEKYDISKSHFFRLSLQGSSDTLSTLAA